MCLWLKVPHEVVVSWHCGIIEGSPGLGKSVSWHPLHGCWQALGPHHLGLSTGLPRYKAPVFPHSKCSESESEHSVQDGSHSLFCKLILEVTSHFYQIYSINPDHTQMNTRKWRLLVTILEAVLPQCLFDFLLS